MKKLLSFLLIALLMLSGCTKEKEKEKNVEESQGTNYTFKYEGKEYELGVAFNVANYGEPIEYSETESYAFDGLNKTYKYDHFEVTTFPVDGEDKLYIVSFTDDKVKTNEGLKISDTFEDMINTYGNDYYNEVNLYSYSEGKKNINIIVQNGFITSIEYVYSVN